MINQNVSSHEEAPTPSLPPVEADVSSLPQVPEAVAELLSPELVSQLAVVANELEHQQGAILRAWRGVVNREDRISSAQRLSRIQFEDHIPEFMQAFCAWLRAPQERDLISAHDRQTAQEHGLHRWHQGYDLTELSQEWGALHRALLDEIERLRRERVLSPETSFVINRTLARALSENIAQSIVAFNETQQAEAASHLQDLESAYQTLRELDRARGQMLRAISHDLRGGLTMVQSATDLLAYSLPPMEEGQGDGESPDELAMTINKGVSSVVRMVSDLLDLARLEAGQEQVKFRQVDAGALLSELVTTMGPLAAEKGLVLRSSGPDTLRVLTDRTHLSRIAQNLLLNAIRYTKEGEVELTWRAEPQDEWSFTVRDTGPGLERSGAAPLARELSQATQLEHRANSSLTNASPANPIASSSTASNRLARGEGIGLTIVKRLCRLLDARLEVDSQPGQGTTIQVVLPIEGMGPSSPDK